MIPVVPAGFDLISKPWVSMALFDLLLYDCRFLPSVMGVFRLGSFSSADEIFVKAVSLEDHE